MTMEGEIQGISKIIIARSDNLGDNILTLPLLFAARKAFPDSEIHHLTTGIPAALFSRLPFIDRLIVKNSSGQLKQLFAEGGYDLFIAAKPEFDEAYRAFVSRVGVRVGTAYRWYSFLFNRKVKQHRRERTYHESEYNLNLLRAIKPEVEYRRHFDFDLSDVNIEEVLLKLSIGNNPFILLHPGSRGSAFDLPISNVISFLSQYLTTDDKLKVILTGTIEEKSTCQQIVNAVRQNTGIELNDTSGKLNIRELAALINSSEVFVSNSTGPIHIAGSLNKKVIGFYPDIVPMKPERWKPLSDSAVILTPGNGSSKMGLISPDEIIKSLKLLLKLN